MRRRWYTVPEVAEMLGYGPTKVRMMVISGDLRSLKDGGSRRILPAWVDEYIERRAAEAEATAVRGGGRLAVSRRPNGEGSIYPYRNGWAAHVWIMTPKGRRQRKTVYGKTREEVHDKWLRLHQQARRGPMAPVSPRLRDFLRRWLRETVKPNLSPTTASNYEMFARLYIVPDLGNRQLDKLMVRDVQVWVNALRTRCQCCAQGKDAARAVPQCCAIGECCHEVASDWTIHQAWRVLRGALTQAMREELVFRNVAALVRVPMPRRQKQPVWTVEEARRFLESARRR